MDLDTLLQAVMVGYLFKLAIDVWRVTRKPADAVENAKSAAAANAPKPAQLELMAELHHGVVYCFEKGTDRFVCQGRTLEELVQMYRSRFPNKKEAVSITKFSKEVKDHLEKQQKNLAPTS